MPTTTRRRTTQTPKAAFAQLRTAFHKLEKAMAGRPDAVGCQDGVDEFDGLNACPWPQVRRQEVGEPSPFRGSDQEAGTAQGNRPESSGDHDVDVTS